MATSHRFLRAGAAAALVLGMLPLSTLAQTKVRSGFNLFSKEQDVEIGRQSAVEVERELPILEDRLVEGFVQSVGARLAAQAPGPRFPYSFRVVDAPELNAFALPGGPIYLNRGVLEAARNEGEVAGVLAHEIAHVALRHGTHNASRATLTQAGLGILGGLIGNKDADTAETIGKVGGFGLNVLFLKYSREAESQSDVIGSQILTKAGYNPADMISFFDLLAKTDSRRTANWLSSHPAPTRRSDRIRQEAELMNVGLQPTTMTTALRDVQARLGRVPARSSSGTRLQSAPRTTTTRSPDPLERSRVEPPSGRFGGYASRSGLYQINFPTNWEVVQEGEHSVTFAPPGGTRSSRGRLEIIYGAMVNHHEPYETHARPARTPGAPSDELRDATNDLIDTLLGSSPYLRVVRSATRRFRIQGESTLSATMSGPNPRTGIRERVVLVTRLLDDGHLVYVLFVTPEDEADAYYDTWSSIVGSLRVADDWH